MRSFRRLSFTALSSVYILIFVGGLVRVSGAGLGCPDWPRCFGRWIPPVNRSQLPADIDPVLFNFTLAWIEYINRMIGMFVGLLVLVTAIVAIKRFRSIPVIMYSAAGAALLTGFQGWYGSLVVGQKLDPMTVSVHMLIALVIACMLIFTTQNAYYREFPETEKNATYPKNAVGWITGLWTASVVQVVLGSYVRAGAESARDSAPLLPGAQILDRVGAVEDLHWLFGVIMFIATWQIGSMILKQSRPSRVARQAVWAMMFLVTMQLGGGIVLVTTGLLPMIQLYHLWFACLYFGTVTVTVIALRKGTGENDET
ncbi:heme A synthase [candidate division KSB1 bacterium]